MGAAYPPSPMLGSGEIDGRYASPERMPYKPQPWYFDNTKSMYVAAGVIAVIVLIGCLFG